MDIHCLNNDISGENSYIRENISYKSKIKLLILSKKKKTKKKYNK